ncbi:MAG: NAD(+) synthase [Bacteroidales bacterium]|nr:NAD(+) synthase [Bacteroidales bacterium]
MSGFYRVATAIPRITVADIKTNVEEIISLIHGANEEGANVVVFPELCVTGYTCADLFLQPHFQNEAMSGILEIMDDTRHMEDLVIIVGAPYYYRGALYNCAFVINRGNVMGIVPKQYIPNYGEFYESRWFKSGREIPAGARDTGFDAPVSTNLIFGNDMDFLFGVELCEDVWTPNPPSAALAQAGAEVIFNLSASNEMVGKHDYLVSLLSQQSARTISAYVYASAGIGESTTDLVFAGNGLVFENGKLIASAKRFCRESQLVVADIDLNKIKAMRAKTTSFNSYNINQYELVNLSLGDSLDVDDIRRDFDPHPFIPKDERSVQERCEEIFNIQVWGLAQRMEASHSKRAVVGISGGLDSTLALLVTARTFDVLGWDRSQIIGVTMPGFGTTGRTYNNAINLMKALGVEIREISIKDACIQHFKDINLPETDRSVTYENSQARERTQILMDIANRDGGLVVGTGDLSELALGWATYNGDQMSMYGVNASVPKTLVKYLVKYVAEQPDMAEAKPYLLDIYDTPISPELLPADEKGEIAQKTEDLVGPYELHDFFIYNYMRFGYSPEVLLHMACNAFKGTYDRPFIKKWLSTFFRRFFNQQFKRSAMPDGPKVGSVTLSPRGDWRMPSDASSALWLDALETLD